MRAPGEPQGVFAAESHIDCVARKIGMDPAAFRLKNLMVEGDETLTGSHYKDIKAKETLAAALKASGYDAPKAKNVGRGVAMGYRGPGGGNTAMQISLEPDGAIVIHTGLFEQGTGTYTTIRQIAAEELRCAAGNYSHRYCRHRSRRIFRLRHRRQPRHARRQQRGLHRRLRRAGKTAGARREIARLAEGGDRSRRRCADSQDD